MSAEIPLKVHCVCGKPAVQYFGSEPHCGTHPRDPLSPAARVRHLTAQNHALSKRVQELETSKQSWADGHAAKAEQIVCQVFMDWNQHERGTPDDCAAFMATLHAAFTAPAESGSVPPATTTQQREAAELERHIMPAEPAAAVIPPPALPSYSMSGPDVYDTVEDVLVGRMVGSKTAPPSSERPTPALSEWMQAIGLLTTLHPTMVMDPDRPLEMAKQIERHVTAALNAHGSRTDEPNPNGTTYARLNWWKDRSDEIAEANRRVEQAEQELAKWKVCENCGEALRSPGICDQAVSEREKGQELMIDQLLTRCEQAERLTQENAALVAAREKSPDSRLEQDEQRKAADATTGVAVRFVEQFRPQDDPAPTHFDVMLPFLAETCEQLREEGRREILKEMAKFSHIGKVTRGLDGTRFCDLCGMTEMQGVTRHGDYCLWRRATEATRDPVKT